MIVLLSSAFAGDPKGDVEVEVDLLLGGRTTPDAVIEQASEWEPTLEPLALGAVVGAARTALGPGWLGLEAATWQYAPDPDAMLLALAPRAGIAAERRSLRFELAGRVDGQLFPVAPDASSVRSELVGRVAAAHGAVRPELKIEGIDRRYPFEAAWSLRAAEATAGLEVQSGRVHGRLASGGQVNEGADTAGGQVRGTAEVGWTARHVEAWVRYRYIAAFGGSTDAAARTQFTPLGDYSEDADALSAGGFHQHRVEVGGVAELGALVVRGSALGRLRDVSAGGIARTGHVQLDLEHPVRGTRWWWTATVGANGARLASGASFLDVYAWGGMAFRRG